jgi:hypothetical protein
MADNDDYVKTKQVICAEPSPDVAKIVSKAFDMGNALKGRGLIPNTPTQAELQSTLALSKSYAEGVAQMTERLATIQLLRDGLYRACEAYSNGAISATTYAAIVSRFDKTMITLLLGELAAGNFGRSLAALASSSSGKASANLNSSGESDSATKPKGNSKDKPATQDGTDEKTANPDSEEKPDNGAQPSEGGNSTDEKEATAPGTQQPTSASLAANAESEAKTQITAAGSIGSIAKATEAISGNLVQLQANYLNDHNVDALKIACISSLGREPMQSDVNRWRTLKKGETSVDRYNYQRALSVWCDEIVESLKRNEEAVLRYNTEQKKEIPQSALKELVVPKAHAFEPFYHPKDEPPAPSSTAPHEATPKSPKVPQQEQ